MSFSKITMPFSNPFSKIINSISTIINRNNGPKVLGRWGLEYCPNKVSRKIDWANEDHCGPCGTENFRYQTIQPIVKKKNINNSYSHDSSHLDYLVTYEYNRIKI